MSTRRSIYGDQRQNEVEDTFLEDLVRPGQARRPLEPQIFDIDDVAIAGNNTNTPVGSGKGSGKGSGRESGGRGSGGRGRGQGAEGQPDRYYREQVPPTTREQERAYDSMRQAHHERVRDDSEFDRQRDREVRDRDGYQEDWDGQEYPYQSRPPHQAEHEAHYNQGAYEPRRYQQRRSTFFGHGGRGSGGGFGSEDPNWAEHQRGGRGGFERSYRSAGYAPDRHAYRQSSAPSMRKITMYHAYPTGHHPPYIKDRTTESIDIHVSFVNASQQEITVRNTEIRSRLIEAAARNPAAGTRQTTMSRLVHCSAPSVRLIKTNGFIHSDQGLNGTVTVGARGPANMWYSLQEDHEDLGPEEDDDSMADFRDPQQPPLGRSQVRTQPQPQPQQPQPQPQQQQQPPAAHMDTPVPETQQRAMVAQIEADMTAALNAALTDAFQRQTDQLTAANEALLHTYTSMVEAALRPVRRLVGQRERERASGSHNSRRERFTETSRELSEILAEAPAPSGAGGPVQPPTNLCPACREREKTVEVQPCGHIDSCALCHASRPRRMGPMRGFSIPRWFSSSDPPQNYTCNICHELITNGPGEGGGGLSPLPDLADHEDDNS